MSSMKRREFLAASVATAALGAARVPAVSYRFSPCLNEVTTLDATFEEDCAAYAAAGFKRIELWFDKLRRDKLTASEVTAQLADRGLAPVSACASEGCLWRGQGPIEAVLPEMQKSFELAQAIGVPRYVVFSYVQGDVTPDDYHLAATRLATVAELAAKHKVRIALEFIARSALLGSLGTTLNVMREAGQPNVGVNLDVCHFFAGISKFEDLEALKPGDVEHVHFHDVPGSMAREHVAEPDRLPPGEGVVPLRKITAALARIGYSGSLSTELFGEKYEKGDPNEVARHCFRALQPYCRA
jgi:2-keto-myo-inositol isomerase